MAIFNSLGSNYRPKHLWHMFGGFDPESKKKLISYLENRYEQHAFLTYKGREALYLALKGLGLKNGAQVAVNGYTCYAVFDSVTAAGLEPVYVDIAKGELNFSLKGLKAAHKKHPKLKVVIIQNTLGYPADMNAIEDYCRDNKLELIEDLAHSIGMKYTDGREAGTVATAALSFSQDKVVDAVSGGALLYKGEERELKARRLGYLRFLKDYYYIFNTSLIRTGYIWGLGKVYGDVLKRLKLMPRPMDGRAEDVKTPDVWHASLALKQFNDLDITIEHRRAIADIYRQNLPARVQFKQFDESTDLRFPILVDDPQSLKNFLRRSGIHISDTWYDAPVSPARLMEQTNYTKGNCPQSEEVATHMVNLPTHINVMMQDAEKVTEKVNQWLSNQEK